MTGDPGRRRGRQKSPLIAEVIGPAGSGKTTLARVLTERDETMVLGPEIELRRVGQIPVFAGTVPYLLPVLLRRGREGGGFAWDEVKAMVYLRAWPQVLRQQAAQDGATILLDHGPVFKLAKLHAFGPERLGSRDFAKWWNQMFERWALTLDMVIWLDAPDATLRERIRGRDQGHVVKEKGGAEVSQFLARYRASYAWIVGELEAKGGLALLKFDTAQTSMEQIGEQVLVACRAHRHAGLTGRLGTRPQVDLEL